MNIKLIIGLGNPGKEYDNTYHNAGLIFIDSLKGLPVEGLTLRPERILKSETFMNTSGSFVKKALKNAGLMPAELLIAHDDSDLSLGEYKLSFGQGAAGHNGITSVIDALKTKDFWRLRIGIRHPAPTPEQRAKAAEFVLKPISKKDQAILAEAFTRAISEFKGKNTAPTASI